MLSKHPAVTGCRPFCRGVGRHWSWLRAVRFFKCGGHDKLFDLCISTCCAMENIDRCHKIVLKAAWYQREGTTALAIACQMKNDCRTERGKHFLDVVCVTGVAPRPKYIRSTSFWRVSAYRAYFGAGCGETSGEPATQKSACTDDKDFFPVIAAISCDRRSE